MLFDPEPKKRIEDFYDREGELHQLLRSMERERLVVIQGIRRLGKSSLLNVALAQSGKPFVKIDLREIYFSHGSVSKFHLYRSLSQELTRLSRSKRIASWLKRVQGVKVAGVEIHLDWRDKGASLSDVLTSINGWASKQRERVIIAFHEAQYLRLAGRIRYDGLVAWAVDNLENLVFVLTGSQVGVLRDFLEWKGPAPPSMGDTRKS
jgi:AAA+ ATPase superfamily predicted ATPase